jgi:Holliday junction DNA helicase RuvA
MIALLSGTLVHRELDRVEILTAGGVGYECLIPLSVFEALPQEGATVTLHTHLAVREDAWHLYGFSDRYDRAVFQRLLVAKGVGPALALGILSSLTPERVVRALREKDITTLMRVPRVGRKKAEQIILDLADKMDSVGSAPMAAGVVANPVADDAIRALIALGYNQLEADRAVRAVMCDGEVIYQEGRFTRVDRDSALKALHDDLSRALADDEVERRQLSKALLPHAKRFYADYIDPSRHEPFYRPSSRV